MKRYLYVDAEAQRAAFISQELAIVKLALIECDAVQALESAPAGKVFILDSVVPNMLIVLI
jgi:hypothetical protein